MHYCTICMPNTNFGLKYSKPVNTVSGCPHEYQLCNVEMGLAGLPCNPDWDMTAYSTRRCSLYTVEQLGQTFCGFTSKQQHILQLCPGPASVRLSCVLTEKPLSFHPTSKYLNGSPAKTTLPQTALQTIPASVWLWLQRIQWPIMWPDVIIITKPSTQMRWPSQPWWLQHASKHK